MGFLVSWVATRDQDRDTVLESFSVARAGQTEEIDGPGLYAVELASGWFLVPMTAGMRRIG
jgi:hypothetical protein